jgi:hypothetical protein
MMCVSVPPSVYPMYNNNIAAFPSSGEAGVTFGEGS